MSMGHELRTPLNAIQGYTELLLEEGDEISREQRVSDLKRIQEASGELLCMIDDVLELSKMESGRLSLRVSGFSIMSLLREGRREVLPLAVRRENTLKISCRENCEDFVSDLGKIRHALRRLLHEVCRWSTECALHVHAHCEAGEGSTGWLTIDVSGWLLPISREKAERYLVPESQEFHAGPLCDEEFFSGGRFGLVLVQRFCKSLGGKLMLRWSQDLPIFSMRFPSLHFGEKQGGIVRKCKASPEGEASE